MNQGLDANLAQFAGRPLAEAFPYLILPRKRHIETPDRAHHRRGDYGDRPVEGLDDAIDLAAISPSSRSGRPHP